jgi:N utilization substance protein A
MQYALRVMRKNMSELTNAIKQICEEKALSYDQVVATIESALAAAYRKDFGEKNQNAKVEFNPDTGGFKVFDAKIVVEDMPEEIVDEESGEILDLSAAIKKQSKQVKIVPEAEKKEEEKISDRGSAFVATEENLAEEERRFNPRTEIQLKDAVMIGDYKIGDEILTELPVPSEFGRMAAQTAKQVIIQRLREAERDAVFSNFKEKEGEVVTGVVQRREGRMVLVDLGKSAGVLPPEEQIPGEKYNPGDRVKIYIKEVRSGSRGAEVVLSRTSDEILKKIFYLEIPEIANGLVELKAVAREAGARSKVAVWTDSENVDPIGSCVGQRGARIQTIISELGGEKVDIILYDEDPTKFIANALAPAKVLDITINEEEKRSTVKVAGDQLSLAIGKGGQNARLAAHLTGWKIDIIEGGVAKKTDNSEQIAEGEDETEIADNRKQTVGDESETDGKTADSRKQITEDDTKEKVQEIVVEKKEKKVKIKKPKKKERIIEDEDEE